MSDVGIEDIRRVEQVRAVTENLFFWQGLRFAPVGPVMMLLGILIARPELDETVSNLVLIGLIVAGSFLVHLIGRRYAREVGRVKPMPGLHVRRSRVKWLVVYPLMFASLWVDWKAPVAVFLSGLTWAAAVLLYRISTGGGREHYVALAAVLAAFTPTPFALGVSGPPLIGLFMLVFGAGMTAGAFLDDREMRRILAA